MSFVIRPLPYNHRHKGAWVQFLVGELRFHTLHGTVKKKRKEPNYSSLQYLLSTYCVPGLGLEAAVIKAEMPYSMVGRGEERKRKDDFTWEKGSGEPSRVVLGWGWSLWGCPEQESFCCIQTFLCNHLRPCHSVTRDFSVSLGGREGRWVVNE